MTDIDAIRKKHEAQMEYTKSKQGDAPYLFQSIHSTLSISDVDALFAALDEARGIIIELVKWHGGIHTEYCPEDDTCDCQGKPINDRINKFLKGGGE